MGRHTYDGFAPVWPTRSGDPVSDQIDSMPKYVVSTTLKDPEWENTQVIDRDIAGEITRLKEDPGMNILQYGFGSVSRLIVEHGLLDELRLWVHPLILGAASSASELAFGETPAVGFRLADTTTLTDGTVLLEYEPDGSSAEGEGDERRRFTRFRCARDARIQASSRVGAGLLPAPPGFGECGVLGSSPAWRPRPSR